MHLFTKFLDGYMRKRFYKNNPEFKRKFSESE